MLSLAIWHVTALTGKLIQVMAGNALSGDFEFGSGLCWK